MMSSAAHLMEIRAQAERDSGIGLKLFGFIPESCSRSPRNSVRNHPGIAFTFPRIPQMKFGGSNLVDFGNSYTKENSDEPGNRKFGGRSAKGDDQSA